MTTDQHFQHARTKHIELLQAKINRMMDFDMNNFDQWELPMDKISENNSWQEEDFFKKLQKDKGLPAVYYFTTIIPCDKSFYDLFVTAKAASMHERKNGKGEKQTYNISHVPKTYKETTCIYAGSVLTGLHGRLLNHLGLGNTGTGGLFLLPVLREFSGRPSIYFNYKLLNQSYLPVIEHIERIIQDYHNPLIGKKALGRLDRELKTLDKKV